MTRLTDLYNSGQQDSAWRACCDVSVSEMDDEMSRDAQTLCQTVVQLCVHNLTLLHHRLIQLGYEFARPDEAFVRAGPNQEEAIAGFEQANGRLPLFLKTLYRAIHSVDFSQSAQQLSVKSEHALRGLGWHPRLIIHSLDKAEHEWEQMLLRGEFDLAPEKSFFLWLGPIDSNEEFVGYELPSLTVDETVSWDEEEQNLRALLKQCFLWGGFPAYRHYPSGHHPMRDFYGEPDFDIVLPQLKKDLRDL